MRIPRAKLLGLVFCVATELSVRADPAPPTAPSLDSQIDSLQRLVIKDEGPASDDAIPPASRHVNALRANVEAKDFRNALTQAKLIAGADPSPAVQKAIDALLPALQGEEDAHTAEVKARLKATLDEASHAVLTLKNPEEFDAVIAALSTDMDQARAGAYGNGGDRQLAYTQLEPAEHFLKLWQSYLVDQKNGDGRAASNDLRNLAGTTSSFSPIPRSELLERADKAAAQFPGMPFRSPAVDAKIELHSLDDLPKALAQIDQWRRTGGFNQELNELYNAIQIVESVDRSYQERNYSAALQQLVNNFSMLGGPVPMAGGEVASAEKDLAVLKNDLLLKVVQGLLAMPSLPPPQKDERATDYLLDMAAQEEKSGDWLGLQKVLEVYQQAAGFNPAPWLQEDLTGLRAYLVGNKLEAAGQHLDAIRSYRQSLATLGRFFPAGPPQAQLDALQKTYPDLYQQALREPINRGP